MLDIIYSFYHNIPYRKQYCINFNRFGIINPNTGIGDALSAYLVDGPVPQKDISVIIRHPNIVQDLRSFNPYIYTINNQHSLYYTLFSIWDIQSYSSFGGHLFQKIQQFLGLPIDIKPQAKLSSSIPTIKNKVVITFDKGAVDQRHIHPRARIIYPESKNIIQQFINANKHIYNFVEVGKVSLNLDNVENKTNIGIEKTSHEIASCDYFFGNHNGLMHIAAALNKKSIIIINFPSASQTILPCLKKVNIPDIDWLYPQNIHLHQDDDGPLVKRLTVDNINKAFNGEIYPFFSDKYMIDTFETLTN